MHCAQTIICSCYEKQFGNPQKIKVESCGPAVMVLAVFSREMKCVFISLENTTFT